MKEQLINLRLMVPPIVFWTFTCAKEDCLLAELYSLILSSNLAYLLSDESKPHTDLFLNGFGIRFSFN